VLYQDPDGGRPWKATPPLAVTTAAADEVLVPPEAEPEPEPVNSPATGKPAISGTARVGETLTADTTAIADTDGLGTFSYQWSADGTAISGATAGSHTLTGSEQGKAITVTVSFTDGAGFAESLTSAATGPVAARPNSPATGAPTISGTAQVGETLTADVSGIADADGLGAFSYQWSADGTAISGAAGASHTLTAAQQGAAISVRVSFTDGRGHPETLASSSTAPVAAAPTPPEPETPSDPDPPDTETKAERTARLRAEYYKLRETAHKDQALCGGICWNHPANAALKAAQTAYLEALFGG